MYKNTDLAELWIKRHDNDQTLRREKGEFNPSTIRDTLHKTNKHAAKKFDTLYKQAIDFGGHPNERSVTGSLDMVDSSGERIFKQLLFHDDDESLGFAMGATFESGMCALEIFQDVFSARFELKGVRSELLELKREFKI